MKDWFVNAYWAWVNCIDARLTMKDNIDRLAFFEELSIGYIQMKDEYIINQHYTYMMTNK